MLKDLERGVASFIVSSDFFAQKQFIYKKTKFDI